MATVIVVIVILLVAGAATYGTQRRRTQHRSTASGIRVRVQEADQSVQAAFRDTRRAMNVAAGQSWRNLAD